MKAFVAIFLVLVAVASAQHYGSYGRGGGHGGGHMGGHGGHYGGHHRGGRSLRYLAPAVHGGHGAVIGHGHHSGYYSAGHHGGYYSAGHHGGHYGGHYGGLHHRMGRSILLSRAVLPVWNTGLVHTGVVHHGLVSTHHGLLL